MIASPVDRKSIEDSFQAFLDAESLSNSDIQQILGIGASRVSELRGPGIQRLGLERLLNYQTKLENACKGLQHLYRRLEQLPIGSTETDVGLVIRRFIDKLGGPDGALQEARWENDFWNFMLRNGQLEPCMKFTDVNDNALEYPDRAKIGHQGYLYAEARLEQSKNPLLRARYAHILWNGPKKHSRYADEGTAAYLAAVQALRAKERSENRATDAIQLERAIKAAFCLGKQAKGHEEVLKNAIVETIASFPLDVSGSLPLAATLIEIMLEHRKLFGDDVIQAQLNTCRAIAEKRLAEKNELAAIRAYDLARKIEKRLGGDGKQWGGRIAECHERMMHRKRADNALAATVHCQDAIGAYRGIGMADKVNELENVLAELKMRQPLERISHEVDVTDQMRRFREFGDQLAAKGLPAILLFLQGADNLLPHRARLDRDVEEQAKQFPLQAIFPTQWLDNRNNVVAHFSSAEEKHELSVLEHYRAHLQFSVIPLVREVIRRACKSGILAADPLLSFLQESSWLAKDTPRTFPDGIKRRHVWLDQIAVTLRAYLNAVDRAVSTETARPDEFVMVIDSLTLKLEGLLREMCDMSEGITFYNKPDRSGRIVSLEKDVHALLYEPPLKELFSEDELLFFRVLLVEKAGLNLRHRVAHALMIVDEYQEAIAHLLFLALLRIAKYDFKEEDEPKKPTEKNE